MPGVPHSALGPESLRHYCTYFDSGFLTHGVALITSLEAHDAGATIWVLCLDRPTEEALKRLRLRSVRTISLTELEEHDSELASKKGTRTRVEYYFTLTPCWPRFLLAKHPSLPCITYLDADMYWFGSPDAVFTAMGSASILATEHRHPPFLRHHRRYGRFNVGILSFLNDAVGRSCLERWRRQCLTWCHDRLEEGRYADQRYLDDWPQEFGEALCILNNPGVNLAPWNWTQHTYEVSRARVSVDHSPLLLFHFARFRPTFGQLIYQSGQLEYGIMPWRLRQAIYGRYVAALKQASGILSTVGARPNAARSNRAWHRPWRAVAPRLAFGSDWIRLGGYLVSGRLGLGRFSGRILSRLRALGGERDQAASAAVSSAKQPSS